jgi:hypothetical protein
MYLNNHDLAKAYQEQLLDDASPAPRSEAEPRPAKRALALAGLGAMLTTIAGVVVAFLKPVS